jgi:hypothetical protein
MENSAEFYYEKLKGTANPGPILAAMLCSLYDAEVTRSDIIICNKLIKTFGRFTTFFSILDMVGSCPDKPQEVYPYLFTICKRKFEAAHFDSTIQSYESLDSFIKGLGREIENLNRKKLKPPSAKGLGNDTE